MADGTINIDVLLHKEKFLPDYESIKNLLTNLGANTGDKMDQDFAANADKMANKARSAHDRIREEMGKTVKQVLKADTSEFDEKTRRANRSRQKFKNPVKQKFQADFGNFNHGIKGTTKQVDTLKEHTEKIKSVIAGTFMGSFLGNTVSNAWASLKSRIGEAKDAVTEYNAKQQVMNATWKTLTGSAKDGKGMVDMVNTMSTALGQDVDVTDELAQQFYHVYNNKDKTEELTKSMLTLGDAIGMGGDRLKQVGLDLTHTLSSGKMQLGDFNQISDAFPMFGEKLLDYERKVQHSSKLSMSTLRDQMSAGKISAQDAANVINGLGQKYKDSADNLMQTLPGMTRKLKSQIPKLFNDILSPILESKNPIVGKISEWSSDPKTEQEFQGLGKKVNKGMQDVMSKFSSAMGGKDISSSLDNMIENFGDFVSNTLHWVADHSKSITNIFKSIGSIAGSLGKGIWEGITGFFKLIPGVKTDGIDSIADGLTAIAKHKQGIEDVGKALVTYFVAKKLISAANSIKDIYRNLRDIASISKDKIASVLDALKPKNIKLRVKWVGQKTLNIARGAVTKFGKIKATAIAAARWAGRAVIRLARASVAGISKLKSYAVLGAKWIGGKAVSLAVKGFTLIRSLTLSSLVPAMSSLWASIMSVNAAMLASPITWIVAGIAAVGVAIYELYKHFKPFRDTVNGIGKAIGKTFIDIGKAIGNVVGGIWKKVTGTFSKIGGWISSHNPFKGVSKWIGGITGGGKKKAKKPKKTTKITHVSKKDIANLKAAIPVMKQYKTALKGLKEALKKNDPTKLLKAMNKRLKSSIGSWGKLAKPIKQIGSAFKALNSFSKSMKSDPFNKLNHDLPKLDKTLRNSKIGSNLKKLKKQLTDNDPTKVINKISRAISKNNSKWSKFGKSSKKVSDSVVALIKAMKSIDKSNSFKKLKDQLSKLNKTLDKSKITDNLKKLKNGLKNNNPTSNLKKVTKGLKDNNPTKILKLMNKAFKSATKDWKSFAKTVKTLDKSLTGLYKEFTKFGKDKSISKLTMGIRSLDKVISKNKIGKSLKSLKQDLKKYNPVSELKKISNQISKDAKDWSKLAKPISTLAKSFKTLSKSMKSIEKNKGLSKLNKDLNKLDKTAAKSKFGSELKKQFQIANKAVGNTGFIKVFHGMTNSIVHDLNRFKSTFERDWERLWKDAASDEKKEVNKIESDLSSSTNKMLKTENSFSNSFEKTWKSLGNALRSNWKSVWKDIADLSNSGMHKTAGYINSGIQGIDYVLSKFGGSPKTISPIKFASGTGLVENGRLTRGTLAMLNDGNDSPETNNVERVVKADGSSYEPAGNNVLHYLEPGDAVLNATENKMFKMSGLTHFADGTGIFSSSLFKGVNGGYQQLIELAERLSSNVNKSFAALFSKKPKIKGDVPKAFETVFKKQADKQGQKWWATVWDVINEAIGGASGDATGLLKAVEKYGTGKPYVWGATGPDSFDCSGLVMYALKKAFGISYPHFSGDQIARTQHISKDQLRPGDLIGNDEHIGVYAGNGKYWSAMSPSSHPNIGMSPVSTFPGTPIYGRVRGLKSEDDKKKKDTKADKGLIGFVKKELGPGVFSFIKKHLAPLVTDSDGVGTASGGKVSGDLIREAAKIAGVSITSGDIKHIENVIQHESGGNPTIVNHTDRNAKLGHPSKGILQFIDSTFRHYAMPGHRNILSALDQLVAMFNDTTWRSDLTLGGWGPTGAVRHANGGWGQWGKLNIFNEVPGEPEVAINPSRATADDLIMETIAERLKKAPNGKLAHALNAISHVPEQAHQFAGKAIANVSNPTNTGASVATAGEGGNINTVINLDGKVIADATYPINQARQSKQITIETKKRGGFH
ncbi:tape measure protein [Pediococcus acidilactici]